MTVQFDIKDNDEMVRVRLHCQGGFKPEGLAIVPHDPKYMANRPSPKGSF